MIKKLLCYLFALIGICGTLVGQVSQVPATLFQSPNINGFTEFVVYNNEIYFGSILDVASGYELLKVANSTGEITQLKDIFLGLDSSFPGGYHISQINNKLYFEAFNGTRELWETDGTTNGTILATDFNSSSSSFPDGITDLNNLLIMSVTENNDTELGVYDPINGSTTFININTSSSGGSSNSSLPKDFTFYNGKLYFSAIGNGVLRELYVTDGTASGTLLLKDINNPSGVNGNSNPENFIVYNGKLYFSADDGINGRELWVTDGTSNGTVLVDDMNSGVDSSNPKNFTIYGNRLYFTATTAASGNELFYINNSESIILYKDINLGTPSSNPENLTVYNGNLYFTADDGINGNELWSADGSIFGVDLFKDINTLPGLGSDITYPKVYNNRLFFAAKNGTDGNELWATDGTNSGTSIVADINSSGSSNPIDLNVAGNYLYFHADNGTNRRLWRYIDPALSISEVELISHTTIYPNPVANRFSLNSSSDVVKVELYSVNGERIKTITKTAHYYDVSELKTGIYFAKIYSKDSYQVTKFIKE